MSARGEWELWLGSPAGQDEAETELRRRFFSLYLDLLHDLEEQQAANGGTDRNLWRKAAYAVWLALPREMRRPRFANELARLLGLMDDDAFRKWRRANPGLFDRAKASCERLINDWLPDLVWASMQVALTAGAPGHQDRKMLLEMGGVYRPKAELMGPGGTALGVQIYLPDNGRDDSSTGGAAGDVPAQSG